MTENQIKKLFVLSNESQIKNNDMARGLQEIANEFGLLKSKMEDQEQKLRKEQKFREEQKLEIQDLKDQIQSLKEFYSQEISPINVKENEAQSETEEIHVAEETTSQLTSNRKRFRPYNPKWWYGSPPKQNTSKLSKNKSI